MPFTPFHMGPGILFKSMIRQKFSLLIFGWTQIVIDLQPLIVMINGEGHVHGFSHTYIGAIIVAFFAGITGKYLFEFFRKQFDLKFLAQMTFTLSLSSALIGTISHVFLDSIMHSDVEPFFPFSRENIFYHLISVTDLHNFCLLSGIVGSLIYFTVSFLNNRKS